MAVDLLASLPALGWSAQSAAERRLRMGLAGMRLRPWAGRAAGVAGRRCRRPAVLPLQSRAATARRNPGKISVIPCPDSAPPPGPMTDTKKVFIRTFGCQMNEYDSDKMADVLAAAEGFEKTSDA